MIRRNGWAISLFGYEDNKDKDILLALEFLQYLYYLQYYNYPYYPKKLPLSEFILILIIFIIIIISIIPKSYLYHIIIASSLLSL